MMTQYDKRARQTDISETLQTSDIAEANKHKYVGKTISKDNINVIKTFLLKD